jgi:hypothetical protein
MVYLLTVLFIIILYVFLDKTTLKKSLKKNIFFVITFLLLFLISGFRSFNVGTDTMQYVNSYSFYSNYGFDVVRFGQIYEPGFMLLMILASKISGSARFFLLITSFFINFSVLHFIKAFSKDYLASICIYICSCQFLVSMCMVRQFIAISIVLLGFKFLLKGQNFKFIIVCLIASMFHYFSVLFLMLLVFKKIRKIDVTFLLVLVMCFIPIYLLFPQIMNYFFSTTSNYADYITSGGLANSNSTVFRIPPMLLVIIAIALPYFFSFKKTYYNIAYCGFYDAKQKRTFDFGFLNLVYLFLVFLVILSNQFGLFTRVYYYFTIFIVLMPNLTSKCVGTTSNTKYYVLISILILAACLILNKGTYGAANYSFLVG